MHRVQPRTVLPARSCLSELAASAGAAKVDASALSSLSTPELRYWYCSSGAVQKLWIGSLPVCEVSDSVAVGWAAVL